MSKPRQTKSGGWELCITHKLLPRRLFFTFDTELAAVAYDTEAQKWLRAGVVPPALVPKTEQPANRSKFSVIIQAWRNTGKASTCDDHILEWLMHEPTVAAIDLSALTYQWAERWVTDMKMRKNLAPSSIRQRVQAIAKVVDWYIRSHPDTPMINPLKLLPRGYSAYTQQEGELAAVGGGAARHDLVRERRLHAGEADRIREVLRGVRKLEGSERGPMLPDDNSLALLFELILHTGVRLREAYTVMREDVNLSRRVIRIRTTKQRHGKVVYREVPIRPELHAALSASPPTGEGALFPFWDGTEGDLRKATGRLSSKFRNVFRHAGCDDLVEHDLRHEATCQWYELRDRAGGWMFRPEEVNKIMGWAPGSVMGARYASFRADSLADRLWA